MWVILAVSCFFQATAVVLNLLPLPGLDGYGALEPWLPRELREWGMRIRRYSFFALLILFVAVPAFGRGFQLAVLTITDALRVERGLIGEGLARVMILRF
jgi:Zn-dependent protease